MIGFMKTKLERKRALAMSKIIHEFSAWLLTDEKYGVAQFATTSYAKLSMESVVSLINTGVSRDDPRWEKALHDITEHAEEAFGCNHESEGEACRAAAAIIKNDIASAVFWAVEAYGSATQSWKEKNRCSGCKHQRIIVEKLVSLISESERNE